MTTLNTLNLVAMPKIGMRDPKQQRRNKLITQLEQQRHWPLTRTSSFRVRNG